MTTSKKLTYWLDIDQPHLPGLSLAERINYFEGRVRLVLITPLDRLIETDEFLGKEDSTALLIAGAAICHGIEAIGRFLLNGRSDPAGGKCFVSFAEKYMDEDLRLRSIGDESYASLLWRDFRCGLSHGFNIRGGGFDGGKADTDPYFVMDGDKLKVNPYQFYGDFRRGFERYLKDLRDPRSPDALRENFGKTFKRIFIKRR
jgi:hypothetical protein